MSDDDRSSSTCPYKGDEGEEDPKTYEKQHESLEAEISAEKTDRSTQNFFPINFDPFSEQFSMFNKFMLFQKEQSKTIDVNPAHNKDKRVILKSKDKGGRSNDICPSSKDRSNDVSPSLLLSTRSNDVKVRAHTPRTNVNGEIGSGKQPMSSSSKYSSSTITSNSKKRKDKPHFVISDQRKKVKMNSDNDDDVDGISIPTQSDMDQRINDLVGDTSTEEEKDDSSESDFDFDGLKQDYLDDDEIGLPIDPKIASLFKSLKPNGLSKEKVSEKAKLYPKPNNCNLDVRPVNPEIWSDIMSPRDRSQDLALQKVQKLNTKTSYVILRIADQALSAKKSKDSNQKSAALKEIIKCATDALAFTTTSNVHTDKMRRELILHKMAQDQRSIGRNVDPDDKLLFGDNLSKKLQEAAGAAKLKLRKPKFNNWNSYQNGDDSKNKFWSRKNPRDRKSQGYKKKYKKSRKSKDSSKKSD